MSAPSAQPLIPAALNAAPELGDYLYFHECAVPAGSGATKAYKGYIRPFSDDDNARQVLRALEAGLPLGVFGGRLTVDASHLQKHEFEDYLVGMAVPCTILLLDFAGDEHPEAFLLDPPMIPRLSECTHLRTDKRVKQDGRDLAALCIFSGHAMEYDQGRSRLEQFLDQAATYLAKYLIWLRTRMLQRVVGGRMELVNRRSPHGEVAMAALARSPDLIWSGYWPGKSAPSGPHRHLATIRPEQKCWCWSGKKYGDCCRTKEYTKVAELRLQFEREQFVRKLMLAVHSRPREQERPWAQCA